MSGWGKTGEKFTILYNIPLNASRTILHTSMHVRSATATFVAVSHTPWHAYHHWKKKQGTMFKPVTWYDMAILPQTNRTSVQAASISSMHTVMSKPVTFSGFFLTFWWPQPSWTPQTLSTQLSSKRPFDTKNSPTPTHIHLNSFSLSYLFPFSCLSYLTRVMKIFFY